MPKKLLYLTNSLLILLCLIAIFGGLVYRGFSLNNAGIIISLILAIISFIIIQYFGYSANKKSCHPGKSLPTDKSNQEKPNNTSGRYLIDFLLSAAYIIFFLLALYILLSHRTANSIISPWQAVPNYFFLIYSLASLSLLASVINNFRFALPLIILHYFLSFSVALIVYRLGYGYDPFIHQATESLIDKTGAVSPKPFYYLGQYSLVVILHRLTLLSVVWLDRLLVPLTAAIFLPVTLWQVLNSWFNDRRLNLVLILSLLALTFPFLIVTTPQNLAYLLLIIVILLGLACKNLYDFSIILIVSFTALIIQPIAGIPALLFSLMLAVYHGDRHKLKPWFYIILALATVAIFPIIFFLLDKKISPALPANPATSTSEIITLAFPGQENFILNFIYLYGFNYALVMLALALGGLVIAWKFREHCRILWLYLAVALSLLASYFITIKVPFSFLIDYERGDYPERVLLMAGLFLLPFILMTIYALLEKIFLQRLTFKIGWAILLALLITTSVYLSYPRLDNYFNSHGYSVSKADLNAAGWINADAKNDYIVLANQQVSAAALSQFGFKKYYGNGQNQIFYYPIPTSSPLYQSYLDMVYKQPSRQTMSAAMNLAGVNEGYFVLNKYWWAFKKILDEAKLSASSWQEIDNGEVYVFKYERK